MSLDVVTGFAAKLFGSISGRRSPGPRENAAQERRAQHLLHPQGYNCPDLTEDRVRVVVFRDEKGVKTPVFDSQVHCDTEEKEKEPLTTKSWGDNMIRHGDRGSQLTDSTYSTCSEGWRGRRNKLTKKPSSDCELLGEMMFGSMPMKVAGNTVKVHYIRSTDQLMLTKVFYLKRRVPTTCSLTTEVYVDSCSLSGQGGEGAEGGGRGRKNDFMINVTRPADPPVNKRTSSLVMPTTHTTRSLCSLPPQPSPSYSYHSPHSPPSPHTLSVSSSYTRRMHRARATSLEVGSELYRKVLKPLDQPSRKGRKYAIGVIVCLSEMGHLDIRHFKDFVFLHFPLIDTHLERLKEGMEEALLTRVEPQRQNMLARATQAYQSFLDDLLSLYKARRMHSPVWLGLVSQQGRRREICMQFMEELGSIVAEIDTKDTKHFFSTLLTAVLSQHLAWVYTVSRTSDNRHARNSKSLGVLAESHPYNPLWAQLGDLFGAVTQPLKVTRTIITGQSYTLVCRLLYLLTYFIRCSEIQPGVVDSQNDDSISSDPLPPSHPHLTPHSTTTSTVQTPHSTTTSTVQLDDTEDIFGSRASSAVTMCPSPHTPGPAGKETPLIRTYPFSFRSPQPTTPEPRSHGSGHEFQHSTSGSADTSDLHSTCRSGSSSTDATVMASLRGRTHTPRKTHSDSLESQHSNSSLQRGAHFAATSVWQPVTTATRQPVSKETVSMTMRDSRDNHFQASAVDLPHAPSGSCFPFSPEGFEYCETESSASGEQGLLGGEEERGGSPAGLGVEEEMSLLHGRHVWQYKKSKETCASLASLESMGMCRLDTGHVRFDITRNYASPTNGVSPPSTTTEEEEEEEEEGMDGPLRIESFDSLSDLAGNSSTFSRNGSSNSIGLAHPQPPLPSSLHRHNHHRSPTHQICGSIDSGYSNDNSIDIASLTESSHTGINDSLLGGPRFVVGLNSHCNPEHSNVFMKPSNEFGKESKTPVQQRSLVKVAANLSHRHNNVIEVDENLQEELEKTAMKRQESDASSASMTVHPPTTRRTDTLDSNTTTVAGSERGSEGGGDGWDTLTRKRSGAFSCHGRSSSTSEDYATADSRTDGSRTSLTGDAATVISDSGRGGMSAVKDVRRLARQRQRQLADEREGEDEVFETTLSIPFPHSEDGVPQPVLPEVLVSCSPPPLLLPSPPPPLSSSPPSPSWGRAGESDSGRPSTTYPVYFPASAPPQHYHHTLELPLSDAVDVEESLSPASMSMLRGQRSLLAERLQSSSLKNISGLPSTPLMDYQELDLPSLEEFHLDEQDTHAHIPGLLGDSCAETHTQPVRDFGHSLFAGHSSTYLPDFVLHGTSESVHSFQPKLERHLASMVKHPTVDEPIEHGVAIIADTDTWTCKLLVATKDIQTNDVDLTMAPVQLSRYVRLMLASFRGMWEMRMPPEFCLSHLEDRLLELNERGLLLANNLMEYGNDVELSEVLPRTFKGLSIRESDETLLLALAGVHCPDPDLRARLNHTFIRRTLTKHK